MLQAADIVIRLNPADDVVIARVEIPEGTMLLREGVRTAVRVPPGHKIAVKDVRTGAPVRRYNQIIGFATRDIAAGDHVHVHNIAMGTFERDYAFCADLKPTDYLSPAATFEGIVRPDGRVATRNYIGIITSVNCSATVAKLIARQFENRLDEFPDVDGVVALTHKTGCGMASEGEAIDILRRTTAGYIRHPNFHSVLLVGLGCESNQINNLLHAQGLKRTDHLHAYTIQDKGGTRKAVEEGVARIKALMPQANDVRRQILVAPAREVLRRDAPLALLAREAHLHEDRRLAGIVELGELLDGRVGRERVDQAHERHDLPHLAALQVADEVPFERIAPALALGLQVLQAVLADQGDPRLGQHPHVVGQDVLGRGQDLDVGPRRSPRPVS